MTWTVLALIVAALSALTAIAAAVVAYIGRPLRPTDTEGLFTVSRLGRTTLALTLLAPFLAAVSAGFSALALLTAES